MRILVTLDDADELQFARVLRLLANEGLPLQVLPRETAAKRESPVSLEPLEFPGLYLDPDRFMAVVDGVEVPLSLLEFRLLHTLASANRVISRAELLHRVWGREIRKRDRGVDAFVKKPPRGSPFPAHGTSTSTPPTGSATSSRPGRLAASDGVATREEADTSSPAPLVPLTMSPIEPTAAPT